MIKTFEFYFDFSSPYSYLAHKEIKKIENNYKIKIKYMPIFLGGMLHSLGIKEPAFYPSKAKFMIRDCKLWAEKNNTTFKFNSYFPIQTLPLMRGVIYAKLEKIDTSFINSFFDAIWKDGLNLNDNAVIEKILKNLNINPKIFFQKIQEADMKDNLKKLTDEAIDKSIFGVPSFVVNNKVFWGQDRLEFVINEAKK